jgi:hypothetical protein
MFRRRIEPGRETRRHTTGEGRFQASKAPGVRVQVSVPVRTHPRPGTAPALAWVKETIEVWHAAFHRVSNGSLLGSLFGTSVRDSTRDRRRASTPLYGEQDALFQHIGTKNAREFFPGLSPTRVGRQTIHHGTRGKRGKNDTNPILDILFARPVLPVFSVCSVVKILRLTSA